MDALAGAYGVANAISPYVEHGQETGSAIAAHHRGAEDLGSPWYRSPVREVTGL